MALMAWIWGWTALAREKSAAEQRLQRLQWAYAALERERDALREACAQLGAPSMALREVLAERAGQVAQEGYTPEHDDVHGANEIGQAGVCYVAEGMGLGAFLKLGIAWPWNPSDWKPKGRRRDTVRGVALLLAQLERDDRAALAAEAPGQPITDRATIERLFELDCLAEEGGVRHG